MATRLFVVVLSPLLLARACLVVAVPPPCCLLHLRSSTAVQESSSPAAQQSSGPAVQQPSQLLPDPIEDFRSHQHCPRDPSRRLHPLRELSSVPVETSPTPASSLESGTSFVGEALNFEGPIPKEHLTEEADSQGESVETTRDSDSDSETEVVLRAASPVVPVSGQQFIVPSGHIVQPQRQAMAAVR
ncbi:hypothetical protein OUZ56_003092 [Daphnia magna]|uniref:Uncharacterized protein n=1 Tax=Daphnia magna TaxID=35525 RepID=A0ABR0A7Q5_9CRUS|nr:hypothetical protein OUZ56_003092 [Daphnia magna]